MHDLVIFPDPRLEEVSGPANPGDLEVRQLAEAMLAQVGPDIGLGIAAVQLGVLVRMVALLWDTETKLLLLNPVLVKTSGSHTVEESCRSLPGQFYSVTRPDVAKVKGQTLSGATLTLKGHGLSSQLLCHELDHLDGILICHHGLAV